MNLGYPTKILIEVSYNSRQDLDYAVNRLKSCLGVTDAEIIVDENDRPGENILRMNLLSPALAAKLMRQL